MTSSDSGFFGDPQSMAIFGALGNMLTAGGTPMRGMQGMGAGNALAMLAGAGMQGAGAGAQAAQSYQGSDIANQQKKMMLDYYKGRMSPPGSLSGPQNSSGPSPSVPNGGVSPLYQQYTMGMMLAGAPDPNAARAGAQMLDTVQRYIGPGKVPNPDGSVSAVPGYGDATANVAGQEQYAKDYNGMHTLPGGRQTFGGNIMPSYSPVFGGLSPSVGTPQNAPVSGPIPLPPPSGQAGMPNSGGATVPPVAASTLFGNTAPPPAAGPSSAGIDPNDPVAMAGATEAAKEAAQVAAAGPKKANEDQGATLAENLKSYNAALSNFDAVKQRIAEMHQAADQSSFNAFNSKDGEGPRTLFHQVLQDPTSVANTKLQQLKDQGLMSQLGPQLAANGVKGNKLLEGIITGADSLDLSSGKPALHGQIDGLYENYIKNMVAENKKAIASGASVPPLPPIMMRTPKGLGTVDPSHVSDVIKAGGSFVY